MSLLSSTALIIINFIEDNIVCKFGILRKLMIDNGAYFIAFEMIEFYNKYHIKMSHSTNYYQQGNCLAEASNNILLTRINKKLGKE